MVICDGRREDLRRAFPSVFFFSLFFVKRQHLQRQGIIAVLYGKFDCIDWGICFLPADVGRVK